MASSVPFGTEKWASLSPTYPFKGETLDGGAGLAHKTVGGTDWWRTTERHSMEGPALGFWQKVGDGFEVSVEVNVNPKVQ